MATTKTTEELTADLQQLRAEHDALDRSTPDFGAKSLAIASTMNDVAHELVTRREQ